MSDHKMNFSPKLWFKKIYNQFVVVLVFVSSLIYESVMIRVQRAKFWFIRIIFQKKRRQEKDKVSIILPTYNRVSLLFERAIPSVLSQTYANWELLVISHGCSDETEARVQQLSQIDNRVKLISIKRDRLGYPPSAENHWFVGPVKPINAGLRHAQGDWIARIDDDDEWLPAHLENALKLLKHNSFEFVSSSYEVLIDRKRKIIRPTGSPPVGGVQTWVYRGYLKFFRSHLSCWRKSWNRVNDTDLQQRMLRSGVRTAIHDGISARITPRPNTNQIGIKAYKENPDSYNEFYSATKNPQK
jgi:glycosyltransferase involved in cell wall biosynthesis